jgi:hypothetical protein
MAGLAAILLPSSLPAQITFQRTYGGAGLDEGYAARQTADGGYIITGFTCENGGLNSNVYLVRTDARGDTVWTRTFGGPMDDEGRSVERTSDGGYVITGYTTPPSNKRRDVWLLKTDAHGETLWTRTFGGDTWQIGFCVQQTLDGGYIIAGGISPTGYMNEDVLVIKTDPYGDTVWTRRFGGPKDDYAMSVQQTADSGYIIAGAVMRSNGSGYDFYLIKVRADGDTQWTRTLKSGELAYCVRQTNDGGYIVAGTGSSEAGERDVSLAKTDANGETLWTRAFAHEYSDKGYAVSQTADGGYVVAGCTDPLGRYDAVFLIKTDVRGDSVWTRTFGDDHGDNRGYSVEQTSDGGYIIGGISSHGDVYLIKTDSLGNVAVAEPKASPTRAPALSLSCEPNPFRTRTAISLQLTADSPAGLAIFDAAGRRVRTLTVNRTPHTVWDGKDELGHALPSGTYFVRLDAAGRHATTRVVLQR